MQSIIYFLEDKNITLAKIIMLIGHKDPPTNCHALKAELGISVGVAVISKRTKANHVLIQEWKLGQHFLIAEVKPY